MDVRGELFDLDGYQRLLLDLDGCQRQLLDLDGCLGQNIGFGYTSVANSLIWMDATETTLWFGWMLGTNFWIWIYARGQLLDSMYGNNSSIQMDACDQLLDLAVCPWPNCWSVYLTPHPMTIVVFPCLFYIMMSTSQIYVRWVSGAEVPSLLITFTQWRAEGGGRRTSTGIVYEGGHPIRKLVATMRVAIQSRVS